MSHKARLWQTDGRTDRQDYNSQDRASIAASRGKNQSTFGKVMDNIMVACFLLTHSVCKSHNNTGTVYLQYGISWLSGIGDWLNTLSHTWLLSHVCYHVSMQTALQTFSHKCWSLSRSSLISLSSLQRHSMYICLSPNRPLAFSFCTFTAMCCRPLLSVLQCND